MLFQAFMQCMVISTILYSCTTYSAFHCHQTGLNLQISARIIVTFKELCTVGFSELGAQQQEKPVGQIKLTKNCSPCQHHWIGWQILHLCCLQSDTNCTVILWEPPIRIRDGGLPPQNRPVEQGHKETWNLTTTCRRLEQQQSHSLSHLFAYLHLHTQSDDHCGTVCHSQGQTLGTPVEYVLYRQLEWTTDTSYGKKFKDKLLWKFPMLPLVCKYLRCFRCDSLIVVVALTWMSWILMMPSLPGTTPSGTPHRDLSAPMLSSIGK